MQPGRHCSGFSGFGGEQPFIVRHARTGIGARAFLALGQHPGAELEGFVAPNAVSIAQAHFHLEAWFRAIHAGDEPAGFVMLHDTSPALPPAAEPEVMLWRLMIDAKHKRRGHGRAALWLVIDHLRQRHPTLAVLSTSAVPGLGSPRPFYESIGFVATSELDDDEEVLVLRLDRPAG